MDKLILSCIVALPTIIGIVISWYLGLFSKVKEIKLANYYKDQINTTKELYGYIVDMDHATNALFASSHDDLGLSDLKRKIDRWNKVFSTGYLYYHRNRIFFPKYIKISINDYYKELVIIRKMLLSQTETIDNEQEYASYYYQSLEDEFEPTQNILKSIMTKVDSNKIVKDSEIIRDSIERLFDKIIK